MMARPRRPQIRLVPGNRPPFITAVATVQGSKSTLAPSRSHLVTTGTRQRTSTWEPAKKKRRLRDDGDNDNTNNDEITRLSQQLSTLAVSRAVLPPTSSAVQFELTMRCPVVFPWLDHTRPAVLEAFVHTLSSKRRTPSSPLPLAANSRSALPQDPRLAHVHISRWLRVPLADGLAAALLAHYLDHPNLRLGFLDGDLFLDALAAGRTGDFCSPFLIVSVLYFSSLEHTSYDLSTVSLTADLLEEALRLWRKPSMSELNNASTESLQTSDSLATVAGLCVLSMGLICTGRGALALEGATAAREMATRLGLQGVQPDVSLSTTATTSTTMTTAVAAHLSHDVHEAPHARRSRQRWLRAASHVAWGGHVWYTMLAHFYHQMPVIYPPALPLPELHPRYTVYIFHLSCKLWDLAHEVALVYVPRTSGPPPLAFAEAKYLKLLTWLEEVNQSDPQQRIRREDGQPSYVVVFHMMVHVTIGKIWLPFLDSPHRLHSLKSVDATPRAIYTASVRQLQDLILCYRTGYPDVLFTSAASAALAMLVSALLRDVPVPPTTTVLTTTSTNTTGRPTLAHSPVMTEAQREAQHLREQKQYEQALIVWRSYFLLCIRCWQDMYTCYPIFRDVVRAHLAQALQSNALSPAEVRSHVAELDRRGSHHYYSSAAAETRHHKQDEDPREEQERQGEHDRVRQQDNSRSVTTGAKLNEASGAKQVCDRSSTVEATPSTREFRSRSPVTAPGKKGQSAGGRHASGAHRKEKIQPNLREADDTVDGTAGPDRTRHSGDAECGANNLRARPSRGGGDGMDRETQANTTASLSVKTTKATALANTGTFVSDFDKSSIAQDGRSGGVWMDTMAARLDDLTLFAEFTTNEDLETGEI